MNTNFRDMERIATEQELKEVIEKLRNQIPQLEQAKLDLQKTSWDSWEYQGEIDKLNQLIDESKYHIARLTKILEISRN